MRKNLIWGLVVFAVMAFIVSVATPNLIAKPAKAKGVKHRTLTIPKHAIEIVPGKMFWLGTAKDKGRLVEGYAIIHHKKGFAKPTECRDDGKCQGWEVQLGCEDCSNGGGGTETSNCFSFLAKGAKWKDVEDYIVDPNDSGLNPQFVRDNLASDIVKWEAASNNFDIIGKEDRSETVDGADTISPDGKNEVFFGDVASPSAIAVTVVWGIFRGPPRGRELVEWDQVYDNEDFDWSEDCENPLNDCTNKMDFENIATHELGHTFGLDDLFTEACSEETMYGFAAEGETNKRKLGNGDSAGVFELYNN